MRIGPPGVWLLLAILPFGRAQGDRVTLATCNLHNYFDSFDDPYRRDEGTPAKSARSRQLLAAAVRRLNPDVLAVQEVENREVLEQFNREKLHGLFAHVVCLEGNDGRGIDVGVLSKLPVVFAATYQNRRWPAVRGIPRATGFARDVLRVRVRATDKTTIDLLVLHLKSKGGGEASDVWRRREVQEVRRILAELAESAPAEPVAVLGDFNDLPTSRPLAPLFDAHARPRLFDVTRTIPAAQRWSFVYGGKRQQLDYLLVSSPLYRRLVPGSARFVRLPPEASDHSALVVVLDLPGVVRRDRYRPPPWVGLKALPPPSRHQAITVTDVAALQKKRGYWAAVTGTVRQVFWSPTGKVCYLNFAPKNKAGVTGVVFRGDFPRFPQLPELVGKTVLLQGVIQDYRGKLEIILSERHQLVVLPPGAGS